MEKSKGFTVIELLVVVVIIVVLTTIILVNVTTYITRGKDSSAKGNLTTMVTNGAVFYDDKNLGNSTYNNFIGTAASPFTTTANCSTGAMAGSGFIRPCQSLINAGYTSITVTCAGTSCAVGATGWCAMINEKAVSTTTFCVDSNGNKVERTGGSCVAGVCS